MQVNTSLQPGFTSAPSSGGNGLASDFETFLRMLTVQIQNQDPLNPMESTEFAVQLATFAGVEQQIRTNQTLAAMTQQLALGTVTQLAGWIGMDARVRAQVPFGGEPVTLTPNIHQAADRAMLVVRDDYNRVIAREPVPLGSETFVWEGRAANGGPLAHGIYNLSIESYIGDSLLDQRVPDYYAVVREARIGQQGAELVLENGMVVNASQITALRRP
jgi:flagellar basal-body rod modification protein FlgD